MGNTTRLALFCFCIAAIFHWSKASDVISTEEFLNRVVMKDNEYEVYWSYDSDYMTFLVFAQTRGYVSFGFSPDGKLRGSDFFIGGVEENNIDTYHDDYHIDWDYEEDDDYQFDEEFYRLYNGRDGVHHVMPSTDWIEDWELLDARENGTHTGIKFRRRFETCDLEEDIVITNGTMRILWGYGEYDRVREEGMVRGNQSVYLKAVQMARPFLPYDAFNWDFRASSARIAASGSTFWCQAFEIPILRQKHHIIMFEPLIETGHISMVTHIALYGCRPPRKSVSPYELNAQGECSVVRQRNDYCTSILYAWGGGGGSLYLPDSVGLPMGDSDQPTYFMLEIHYNNPEHTQGVADRSGVRLVLTPTLRQYDAGVMEVGYVAGRTLMIPPRMDNFTVQGHCPGKCLSQALQQQSGISRQNYRGGISRDRGRLDSGRDQPRQDSLPGDQQRNTPQGNPQGQRDRQGLDTQNQPRDYGQQGQRQGNYGRSGYGRYGQDEDEGISVFANVLRAHGAARRVRLRHVRNGIEMLVVDGDENYDVNLQEVRLLADERNILPGDDLIVECTYNTTERSGMTWGGTGTSDEICSSVMYYYPRQALARCQSNPLVEELFPIISSQRTSTSSFHSDVSSVIWTYSKSRRLEDLERRAKRYVVCETHDNVEYQYAREIMKPVAVSLPQPWPQRRCNGNAGLSGSVTIQLMVIVVTWFSTL